jgi:nucleotide-binding universal stress UspA family protein
MKVRTMIGVTAAYACIEHKGLSMDVKLSPGKSAAQSLRETAEEWRAKAQRLQENADLMVVAAAKLEEAA